MDQYYKYAYFNDPGMHFLYDNLKKINIIRYDLCGDCCYG